MALTPLPKRRQSQPRKPKRLLLAENPVGHDPWRRRPWGSVFATTRDGRAYGPSGEQWFFNIDADGFVVRTVDGRPVGYRWRIKPQPPAEKPVAGFLEILETPGPEVAEWLNRRFGEEG
jgi:hypothetical protein